MAINVNEKSVLTNDIAATSENIGNTLVMRDANGNISINTATGTATHALNSDKLVNMVPDTTATANTIVQRDSSGNSAIGAYLGRVATKGLLNGLSANYQDFAWVDDEQAFYWYAGNGWFSYDVKRLKEGFTLVNLLGSYGSFSKDSNGDGLADGLLNIGGNIYTDGTVTFSVDSNGQKFTCNNGTVTEGSTFVHFYIQANLNDILFINFLIDNQQLETGYSGLALYDSSTVTKMVSVSLTTQEQQNIYEKSLPLNLSPYYVLWLYPMEGHDMQENSTNITVFKQLSVYDLTWMDQYSPMPQSLQEKYSVSKWVDMTDDDLANELPYVNSVGYVGVGL